MTVPLGRVMDSGPETLQEMALATMAKKRNWRYFILLLLNHFLNAHPAVFISPPPLSREISRKRVDG
jgi:hypothetical protein